MFTKTNNKPRPLVSWYDLPRKYANEWFDYVEDEDERWTLRFFDYRGEWYDTHDGFTVTSDMPKGIEAWQAQSAFSAIGIRYDKDYENVVVTYCHW